MITELPRTTENVVETGNIGTKVWYGVRADAKQCRDEAGLVFVIAVEWIVGA